MQTYARYLKRKLPLFQCKMIKDQSISKGDLVNYRREQIVFNPTGSHHYITITTPAIVLATYKQDPALPKILMLYTHEGDTLYVHSTTCDIIKKGTHETPKEDKKQIKR